MAPKSWGTANCSHTLSLRSGRGFPTDGAELAPSKQGEADEVQPKPSWDRVCELQSWEMAPAGMLRHRSLPPGATSGALLPPWAVERWLGRVCFGKQLSGRHPLSQAASGRGEDGVRVQDHWQSTSLSHCCLQAAFFGTGSQAHLGTSCCRRERQTPQK